MNTEALPVRVMIADDHPITEGCGDILKNRARKELVNAIRQVYAGHKYIDSKVAAQISEFCSEEELSSREIDVLRHVASGYQTSVGAAILRADAPSESCDSFR